MPNDTAYNWTTVCQIRKEYTSFDITSIEDEKTLKSI
jgi:hypothetical protein